MKDIFIKIWKNCYKNHLKAGWFFYVTRGKHLQFPLFEAIILCKWGKVVKSGGNDPRAMKDYPTEVIRCSQDNMPIVWTQRAG